MFRGKRRGVLKWAASTLAFILAFSCGLLFQRNYLGTTPAVSSRKTIFMLAQSTGNCEGLCGYPIYKLYDNGEFEEHKNLSNSELKVLSELISATDLAGYKQKLYSNDIAGHPYMKACPSIIDGGDAVYFFPEKHGGKKFTVCLTDIPKDDKLFSFLGQLIKVH
jgi:hypothetical protein